MSNAKDLSQEPPRSPRTRLGGYSLAARMIDKGRADLAGTAGEYHYACPVDQTLFEFKGVTAEEVKDVLASGADDQQVVDWLNSHGTPKTPEEIQAWSAAVDRTQPIDTPDKKAWFTEECTKLGLDPEKATLADYLDADDIATFKK